MIPGVFARHDDRCPARNGQRCTCGRLSYRSSVRDWENDRRVLSPQFHTTAEAQVWLAEQALALQAARGLAVVGRELGAVIDEFVQAAEEGNVRNRQGEPYTREELRELGGALSYVDAELGLLNVADVRRGDVQGLVDHLGASGLTVERVYDVVDALDALYAFAIQSNIVGFSPIVWLSLPTEEDPVGPHVEGTEATVAANDYPSGGFEPPPTGRSVQPAGRVVVGES